MSVLLATESQHLASTQWTHKCLWNKCTKQMKLNGYLAQCLAHNGHLINIH